MTSEHAKLMKNMTNIEISNDYSRNINNAKRFANKFNIKKFTNNLNEIFENKIDGVLICVSADKIYLVTCKVLKYQILDLCKVNQWHPLLRISHHRVHLSLSLPPSSTFGWNSNILAWYSCLVSTGIS